MDTQRTYRHVKTGELIVVTTCGPFTSNGKRTGRYEFTRADGTTGRLVSAKFHRQYERVEQDIQTEELR